ncbi:EamA family transporter RarD [Iamia sp. SCSIO 61187]|uniref:EamA family transporter RarD n=1 Tax=Iamia sp. SCSIO 61187 TaxID=2722752 RepID=UPI001C630D29|nr:EamA family transporter RarD [Iamia sp. SCSIO 61187]QYG94178.1 EamA family transporter RarD [Iamia sp. SCSIO 61187]
MSTGPDHGDAPSAADRRTGILAGVGAYTLWGVFPLVFHQIREVLPAEVLMHRVAWSFVVVAGLLGLRRETRWWQVLRTATPMRTRLAAAAALITVNWLVYVWAVSEEHVVEAALGYYINPLITVALGVLVLREGLTRLQVVALGFAAAAVAVLTVAYGRVPWVALVLAFSFAGYGFLKKAVVLPATTSLAVETAILLPFALVGLVVVQVRGDAAFLHGSLGRDLLLVGLGVVTAVPLVLFGTAARRIPLTLLGLLQYLTPTFQLLCGVLVLDEDLPPERLAGFVLVWVALALLGVDAVRTSRRRDELVPVAEAV